MEKQAIVLAGGLGTRLRSVVADLPKCMAPVKGKPFLYHVIHYLKEEDVDHIIFSLGYMHEVIEKWLIEQFPLLSYSLVIENEPLGTGGAISQAMKSVTSADVLVLNGDTMFRINTAKLLAFHTQHHAACTLTLKPMHHFDRYGIVDINKEGYIQSFREKQYYEDGLINGGVYALNAAQFRQLDLPEKFSFEKDYLEKFCSFQKMMGLIFDDYFIDIGIPEDLARADVEL